MALLRYSIMVLFLLAMTTMSQGCWFAAGAATGAAATEAAEEDDDED